MNDELNDGLVGCWINCFTDLLMNWVSVVIQRNDSWLRNGFITLKHLFAVEITKSK